MVRTAVLTLANVLCPVADASCALSTPVTGVVARVIDGETLALEDGSELRLIGAKAPGPPLGARNAPWPIDAETKQALESLAAGATVEYRFGGRRTDRYGRLLAQVFVTRGRERVWLQSELIGRGLARAYSLADNRACAEELFRREADARSHRRALWRLRAYRVREAAEIEELLGLRFSFQIVEGRVKDVGESRRRLYLNFSDDWRKDFTVTIAPGDRKRFEQAGVDPKALAGRRVRVRGWLDARNGPSIAATHPEQIEIIEPERDESDPPERKSPAHETPGSIDL